MLSVCVCKVKALTCDIFGYAPELYRDRCLPGVVAGYCISPGEGH